MMGATMKTGATAHTIRIDATGLRHEWDESGKLIHCSSAEDFGAYPEGPGGPCVPSGFGWCEHYADEHGIDCVVWVD